MTKDLKNKAGKTIKSEYFRHVNGQFKFEAWMIEGSDHTQHALGAAFALAEIKDNEFIRISVAQQRILFGKNLIGNRAITLRQGRFIVLRTCAFGGDWDSQYLTDIMENDRLNTEYKKQPAQLAN